MITPYKSPVDTARNYLGDSSPSPEENNFIEQMKQQGYDENAYLPAIASKRMRAQDASLAQQYDSYQKSPSGYLSNMWNNLFPKTKLSDTKPGLDRTLWFAGNFTKWVPSTLAWLGDAAMHPVRTAESISSIAGAVWGYDPLHPIDSLLAMVPGTSANKKQKSTRAALKQELIDNFGSIDKAAETFYQNPFEILQLFTGAGAWSKVAWASSKLGKVVDAISGWKTAMPALNSMKDLTNWDIHMMWLSHDVTAKPFQAASKGLQDTMSKMAFGQEWAYKAIQGKASTIEGAKSLTAAESMTPEQKIAQMNTIQPEITSQAKSAMDAGEAAIANDPSKGIVSQLPDSAKISSFKHNVLKDAGLNMKMTEDGVKFTKSPWKDPSYTPAQRAEAETVINDTIKELWDGSDFTFGKSNAVMKNLSKYLDTAGSNPLVKPFRDWIRQTQNKLFPDIAAGRATYNKLLWDAPVMSESGKQIASSGFLPRVNKIIGDTSMEPVAKLRKLSNTIKDNAAILKPEIEKIHKMTGVDLEALAMSAFKEKTVGSSNAANTLAASTIGGTMAAAGSALARWDLAGAGIAAGTGAASAFVGTKILTSPAILYRVAKMSGELRGWITRALAKATNLPESKVSSALAKVSTAIDKAAKTAWLVKGTPSARQALSIFNKLSTAIQDEHAKEDLQIQRSDLQSKASGLEESLSSVSPKTTTPSATASSVPEEDKLPDGWYYQYTE